MILLIVPLRYSVTRRVSIPAMISCAAVSLLFCALSPSFFLLLFSITLLFLTTFSFQLLTPLSSYLSYYSQLFHFLLIFLSLILTFILLSLTLIFLISFSSFWLAFFGVAAAAYVSFAIMLYRVIPPLAPKAHLPYPALIASVRAVIPLERSLRCTIVLSSTAFRVFTMFCTALTFLLSAPPFSYPVSVISLFSLASLSLSLSSQRSGRLHHRGSSLPATRAACALALVAFIVAAAARRTVARVLIAIVLLHIAIQSANILNQSRLFTISGEARSRLNTAYITATSSAAPSVRRCLGPLVGCRLDGRLHHRSGTELLRARRLRSVPPQSPRPGTDITGKSLDIAQWANSAQHGGNCVTQVTHPTV